MSDNSKPEEKKCPSQALRDAAFNFVVAYEKLVGDADFVAVFAIAETKGYKHGLQFPRQEHDRVVKAIREYDSAKSEDGKQEPNGVVDFPQPSAPTDPAK